MPIGLKVEMDIRPALAMASVLSENAIKAAWRRALKKTGVWVKTYVAKGVSREIKIPQKVLRQRLYFFLRSMAEGKVWLGANPIEAHRLGAPRQTRRGVTVGRHRFDSAWIYHSKKWPGPREGKVFRRVGDKRKPYAMVRFEWDEAGERVFREVASRAEERLMQVLQQELNYEMHKLKGRHG